MVNLQTNYSTIIKCQTDTATTCIDIRLQKLDHTFENLRNVIFKIENITTPQMFNGIKICKNFPKSQNGFNSLRPSVLI